MSESAAIQARERFIVAMQKVAIGAKLARLDRAGTSTMLWTVTEHKRHETSVELTLRHGRHERQANVPVCFTGPCLADVGLRSVALAPEQRGLV